MQKIVRNGGTGVVRLVPAHRQSAFRLVAHRGRVRFARWFDVVLHGDGYGLRCSSLPCIRPARHFNHNDVFVVPSGVRRSLEVRFILEVQLPGVRNLELVRIGAAGDLVAGDTVVSIHVLRGHPACQKFIFLDRERIHNGETGRFVLVRDGNGYRPLGGERPASRTPGSRDRQVVLVVPSRVPGTLEIGFVLEGQRASAIDHEQAPVGTAGEGIVCDAVGVIRIICLHAPGRQAIFRGHQGRVAGKYGDLVHVGKVDEHGDAAVAAVSVSCLHSHRIAWRGLVVVGFPRPGADLPVARVNGEVICIRAFKDVGQRGVLGVRGVDRIADILHACRVFGQTARGAGSIGEYRQLIRVGSSLAGLGPRTRAFVVARQHLHMVGGVRRQARDGRCAVRAVEAPRGEPAGVSFPVLYVVIADVGTGVDRLVPCHVQAGRRCRHDAGRRGCFRRFAFVDQVDGHRDGITAALAVFRANRHVVVGLPLEVVGEARSRLKLVAIQREGGLIRAFKVVAQCPTVVIPCGYRVADVVCARGILGKTARGACALVEGRRPVGDGSRVSGLGPGAYAFVAAGQHLHLVGGVGFQPGDGGGRAWTRVR